MLQLLPAPADVLLRDGEAQLILRLDSVARLAGRVAVDSDGALLATLPITAHVVRISPAGEMSEFGRRGSAPGRFGVPMGIAVDRDGKILVSDVLRCVILVFSKDFKFLREFGTRSFKPEGLIAPGDLLADAGGRVYISQLRKRGVSVFQVGPTE